MKQYQMWFSVINGPNLTPEEKRQARKLASGGGKMGNIVSGRRLERLITPDPITAETWINANNKGPVAIFDCRDEIGCRFGYHIDENGDMVPTLDEEGNPLPSYPIDDGGYNAFMEPYESTDIDGNPIMVTPSPHTQGGFAGWEDRIS